MTRRFVIAALVAGLLGALATNWLVSGARAWQHDAAYQRSALARITGLADLVQRVSEVEGGAQSVIEDFADAHPDFAALRVVEGRDLAASTSPDDVGGGAAPRRLQREEKPLFDRWQELRAAVENNLQPENPRKEEVAVQAMPDRGLEVAVPLEQEGTVVGMVQAMTKPVPPAARPSTLLVLLIGLIPGLVMLAVVSVVGDRRRILAVAAAVLVALVVVGVAVRGWQSNRALQRQQAADLGAQLAEEGRFAADRLIELGVPVAPSLEPSSWDADDFRQSRGLLADDGSVREQALESELSGAFRPFRRFAIAVAVVALALCLFIGLGGAARLWATVVRYRQGYAYTTPAMVGMIILVFFPFAYGIGISFTNQNIYNVDKLIWEIWIGADNYVDILTDFEVYVSTDEGRVPNYQNFYWTLGFTIVWTVTNVTIGVTVGLFLALILNTKGLRLRPIYRVLLILPWAVPNYITALIWRGMFHQQFGVINQVVQMFGGDPVSWFETPSSSFLTILATNSWLSFPFMMVISLGALQSIPSDLYEAARVDGASRWQQFTQITLPSLKPALVPAIILSVVWTFNMFNIPYLVSAGEPAGATEILITDAYKIAFEQYRYGYAAAYATVIFGILLMYGVWQNRVTRATEGI